MWTPQILNVEEQQADSRFFAVLHDITEVHAEPLFIAQITGYATQDLSDSYMAEVQSLEKFLAVQPSEVALDDHFIVQLKDNLADFLRTPLSEAAAADSDVALAKELAQEFAGGLWATIISTLQQECRPDQLIDPQLLVPLDLAAGRTALLDKVLEHSSHFAITAAQLNELMLAVWQDLNGSALVVEGILYLPERLKIDQQALDHHLRMAASHRSKDLSFGDMIAVQSSCKRCISGAGGLPGANQGAGNRLPPSTEQE